MYANNPAIVEYKINSFQASILVQLQGYVLQALEQSSGKPVLGVAVIGNEVALCQGNQGNNQVIPVL
jgi:hypothetical protein